MRDGLFLTIKSIAVLVGILLFVLGGVEVGMALQGEGSYAAGLPVLVAGAVIAGIPLYAAFREMVEAARKEGRLPPKGAKRRRAAERED